MDSLRAFDDGLYSSLEDEPAMDPPPEIGRDERRMIVRAYNHWVSMLGGRDYPSVEDLEPEKLGDFGPHGVLLDFTAGAENPGIAFIGHSLRAECDLPEDIRDVGQVPKRSLLSRLTDHYLQIIANRAPIGFEAEFVSMRGVTTLYRGILMPLSSDGDSIDFIYGVINWKEMADPATQAGLAAEIGAALAEASPPRRGRVWADSASAEPDIARAAPVLSLVRDDAPAEVAEFAADEDELPATDLPADAELGDRLLVARESADALKAADGRSRAALYRALGQAYDFALATEDNEPDYLELLEDCGLTRQERAPMTPIVKLVFGADYDKARVTEFAAALAYGRRQEVVTGGFSALLDRQGGGLKALVAAERACRRPAAAAPAEDALASAKAKLTAAAVLATVDGLEASGDFVLLLARREPDGRHSVLATDNDGAALGRFIRQAARAR